MTGLMTLAFTSSTAPESDDIAINMSSLLAPGLGLGTSRKGANDELGAGASDGTGAAAAAAVDSFGGAPRNEDKETRGGDWNSAVAFVAGVVFVGLTEK